MRSDGITWDCCRGMAILPPLPCARAPYLVIAVLDAPKQPVRLLPRLSVTSTIMQQTVSRVPSACSWDEGCLEGATPKRQTDHIPNPTVPRAPSPTDSS